MKYILPIVSVLILFAVIAGGAFYLGQKSGGQSSITPTPTVAQVQTQTNVHSTTAVNPTISNPKTVIAGGALSFSAYKLITPSDWISQREQGQDNDRLTLTKNGYKIVIYEAAFGGGGCLYPGDAPSEMAQTFSSFVEIIDPNGFVFRRSPTGTAGNFTVCQKNSSDGSFGSPTAFGAISITTPVAQDASIMGEIDGILASINK